MIDTIIATTVAVVLSGVRPPSCPSHHDFGAFLQFLRSDTAKYHKLGGLAQQEHIFSMFWRLEV